MAALLDELNGEVGSGRIARPYLDVWFQAGKSPYKTAACSASRGRVNSGLTSATGVPSIGLQSVDLTSDPAYGQRRILARWLRASRSR
jgi:hypothetical protein